MKIDNNTLVEISDTDIINGTVIIPDTVEMIKCEVFRDKEITHIEIPKSVTSIGYSAFDCCKELRHVKLNYGLLNISSRAFANCTNLKEIIIPDSVIAIADNAFRYCINLEVITMSNSVIPCAIMLNHCNNLKEIWYRGKKYTYQDLIDYKML